MAESADDRYDNRTDGLIVEIHRPIVDGFDGDRLRAFDDYKASLLAAAEELRRRIGQTRALGDLLTGDMIARGTRIIRSMGIRDPSPLFPPIFLTFLDNLPWVGPTDTMLLRMLRALIRRPRVYRHFLRRTVDHARAGLFELNVWDVLERAFPRAEPQPRLAGSSRSSDVRIVVEGRPVFVEATAMGERAFYERIATMMRERGLSVHAYAAPGPADEAHRIVGKIGEELTQTASNAPNVLAMSFQGTSPIAVSREWAFEDAFAGGRTYGTRRDGPPIDLQHISRVDAIFEFDLTKLQHVHVNPRCNTAFRLSDSARDQLRAAFAAEHFMIR